jgi:hypothetical protein
MRPNPYGQSSADRPRRPTTAADQVIDGGYASQFGGGSAEYAPESQQFETERLHPGQHAVQRCLAGLRPSEDGFRSALTVGHEPGPYGQMKMTSRRRS